MKNATKLSEVFCLTRKYMQAPIGLASQFICCNIEDLYSEGYIKSHALRDEARKIITERLGGEATIERWLYTQRHITRKQFINSHYGKIAEKIYSYRISWLKELEREFANKGD